MAKIYYIGQYAELSNERNLMIFPSAITKMNYIIGALERAGMSVHIFSPAVTTNNFFCYYPRKTKQINNSRTVTFVTNFGGPTIIFKFLSRLYSGIQLFLFLLFTLKRKDKVLVYHSLVYKWPINIARRLKNINLYFEVEELYHAAWKSHKNKINDEIRYLSNAKGYVLVNDLIAEKCGFRNSKYSVCYGDYTVVDTEITSKAQENVNIVYAGVIESVGSDVDLAIQTMYYLPANYKLHILGYGSDSSIRYVKRKLSDLNRKRNQNIISYHGCLSGTEYIDFLRKCDIGLCTRVLDNELSNYTFPSKVLVYLGNNLIPVCTPISAVKKSQVSSEVVFSNDLKAESLANAILSIIVDSNSQSGKILKKLDSKFVKSLDKLFV
ncbi:hypothetical protein [Marinifilum fragile]|uniref:hypothetical protein n=1 Tax=Marinifilum fragile TaxID=570161 RepID=UPI002AAAEFAB|nr:hypothetical protein [Marinifilum fragile]